MMRLVFYRSSPFARTVRILIREWRLAVEEEELTGFPLPARIDEINPMGQVPVLIDNGEAIFPTFLIIEKLAELAKTEPIYVPDRDRQLLITVLQMSDALASARYQLWAGLGPVGPNRLGFDPAERHLVRTRQTLDWLAPRLAPGLNVPGVALASILLWSEARERLEWPLPLEIERIVAALRDRPSFMETAPLEWSGHPTPPQDPAQRT